MSSFFAWGGAVLAVLVAGVEDAGREGISRFTPNAQQAASSADKKLADHAVAVVFAVSIVVSLSPMSILGREVGASPGDDEAPATHEVSTINCKRYSTTATCLELDGVCAAMKRGQNRPSDTHALSL